MGGYIGKLGWIDLSTGTVKVEEIAEDVRRKYIGGTGLAAYILRQFPFSKIDPLGPENVLVFSSGPLTGANVPTSGRYAVAAKSPLTGVWGEADSGGKFGISLKAAGYDAIAITGRASSPAVLSIIEGSISIVSAESVWGKDTYDTHDILARKYGSKAAIVCIGPPGERMVPLACIMTEGSHARAAGRCGLGAVMGSKQLKAIVADGTARTPVEHPKELQQSIRELVPVMMEKMKRQRTFGTPGGTVGNAVLGDLSAHNWTDGNCGKAAECLSGEIMMTEYAAGKYHCPPCVIGCGKEVRVPKGPYAGTTTPLEYETIGGFGPQCGAFDWNVIIEANNLCNRLGMDTISVSGAVAFVFEAVSKNLIKNPSGGPKLEWGNGEAVLSLVQQIASGEGLGTLMQGGIRKAAQQIGPEADKFAMHVKGLEPPYHDPRALASLAVAYATAARGACHRGCTHLLERVPMPGLGYPKPLDRLAHEGKGKSTAIAQNFAELFNNLKLCSIAMSALDVPIVLKWTNYVTGWDMDAEELLRAGERSFNVKRLLNISCGLTRADDTLPYRFTHEPFPSGASAGHVPDLPNMLDEYYEFRGWGKDGVPSDSKLRQLGLA
ncbi:MAG: aldehyde ferredoxin oxidoreductase family protein [Candidatus Korobacteraceae bacterium]|jgi:aldehyde:ferredoxin oxidoreductase